MNIDITSLIEQAKNLQNELETSRKKTEQLTTTGEAGAGMVEVTINGANRILSIKIADELINVSEKKMLEDLIVAAVNNAIKNMSEMTMNEMKKITNVFPNFPNINI